MLERSTQAPAVRLAARVVGLELALLPERLERAAELLEHVRQVGLRHLDHPLVAAEERRVGEVRGTDVGRVEVVGPLEEPGLGVETGATCVVRDPHLRAGQPGDRLDSIGLGGAHVRGRQEPQGPLGEGVGFEGALQATEAGQRHEAHERIDGVSRRDFARQLVAESWLPLGPGEQRAYRERQLGSRRRFAVVKREEESAGRLNVLSRGQRFRHDLAHQRQDAIRQRDLTLKRILATHSTE